MYIAKAHVQAALQPTYILVPAFISYLSCLFLLMEVTKCKLMQVKILLLTIVIPTEMLDKTTN